MVGEYKRKKGNVNMNMGMKGIWEYEQQAR